MATKTDPGPKPGARPEGQGTEEREGEGQALQPQPERTPGLAPGAEVIDPNQGRYGSPPASLGPDVLVPANSARAMIEEVVQRELRKALGKEGEYAEQAARDAKEAERRAQQRQEREAAAAQEHLKQLATYKAVGTAGKVVGEIGSESPGGGRRLVRGGEVFRMVGNPSLRWMQPVDELAEQRIEQERERQADIARAASGSELARVTLTKALDDIDRVGRANVRQAGGNADMGAAGTGA